MRNRRAAPLLALLLVAGCDRDPAELAREIDAAREGCTEQELRAASEACVQMMERYAEMGTEAIGGYIGAVRALDQALRRMPAARFDTAGVGHAISPGIRDGAPPAARRSGEPGWDPSPRRDDTSGSLRRPDGSYPRDRWYPGDAPYGDPAEYDHPNAGDLYNDPYGDPYGDPRGYDPRYEEEPRYGYPPEAPGGYRGPARPGFRPRGSYDPRYDGDPSAGPDRWSGPEPGLDPRSAPQARGRLLPPEQRLRRPWLDDARARDPRWPQRRPDGWEAYPGWEDEERLPPRRDPPPRYPR